MSRTTERRTLEFRDALKCRDAALRAGPDPDQERGAALLSTILEQPVSGEKVKKTAREVLESPHIVAEVEQVLPPAMAGQARRLVAAALLSLTDKDVPAVKKGQPQTYDVKSFIKAVVDAASIGLAIDKKLAYAVTRWDKHRRANTFTFQISYLGLVAVARQAGTIASVTAKHVWENEEFEIGEENGGPFLRHRIITDAKKRGAYVGCYSRITLPNGLWEVDWMNEQELLQRKAVAETSYVWEAWPYEQRAKTVLRHHLKLYQSDPMIAAALALDNEADLSKRPEHIDLTPKLEEPPQEKSAEPASDEPEIASRDLAVGPVVSETATHSETPFD